MRVWIKKRTGKLVPVDVEPEDQLKAAIPLAKLRAAALAIERGGEPLDLEQKVGDLAVSDGEILYVAGEPIFAHLYFQRPDGKQFEVEGKRLLDRNIQDIKETEIAPRTKVDPAQIKLFMGCIELDEKKTLFDYHIEYGEYLTVKY